MIQPPTVIYTTGTGSFKVILEFVFGALVALQVVLPVAS